MSEKGILEREYDVLRQPGDLDPVPPLLRPGSGVPAVWCFCLMASRSLRDSFTILSRQLSWAESGAGSWYRLSELLPGLKGRKDWLARRLIAGGLRAPSMLQEALFVSSLHTPEVEQSRRGNPDVSEEFRTALARAAWYVLLDYSSAGLFPDLQTLRRVLTSRDDKVTVVPSLLNAVLMPRLPRDEARYAQWGISGILMLLFRIFSEYEVAERGYCASLRPDHLFGDVSADHLEGFAEGLLATWNSDSCASYRGVREASGVEGELLGGALDVESCLDALIRVFRAYLFGKVTALHGTALQLSLDDDPLYNFERTGKELLTHLESKLNVYLGVLKRLANDIQSSAPELVTDETERSWAQKLRGLDDDLRRTASLVVLHCLHFLNTGETFSELRMVGSVLQKAVEALGDLERTVFASNEGPVSVTGDLALNLTTMTSSFRDYLDFVKRFDASEHWIGPVDA